VDRFLTDTELDKQKIYYSLPHVPLSVYLLQPAFARYSLINRFLYLFLSPDFDVFTDAHTYSFHQTQRKETLML